MLQPLPAGLTWEARGVPELLGLLLAEEKKLPEAAEALGKAVTLLPDGPPVGYD